MKRNIAVICSFFMFYISVSAQEINIIPQPAKVSFTTKGEFVLSPSTVIIANKKEQRSVHFLNNYLQKFYYYNYFPLQFFPLWGQNLQLFPGFFK